MRSIRNKAVLAYLRVSTEEQAASGLGVASQRHAILSEAARRSWEDIEFVVDDGYSAKTLARPGVREALERLGRGDASVLVVSKLDRLSRSLLDFATLMDRSRKEGWEIVVLDLALDTSTPNGNLMANIMASFAEFERQLISARTAAALQELKARGVRLGRPRTLPCAITMRIQDSWDRGMSLTAIANALNLEQVPTARGGRRWYPSTIKAALASNDLDRRSLETA